MSIPVFLRDLNEFLLKNSGVPGTAFLNFLSSESDIKRNFFQPYQSKSDLFFRSATVITAPITLTAIALEFAALTLGYAIKSLVEFVMLRPSDAVDDLGNSAMSFMTAIGLALAALASPVINAVDLIGSGVVTLRQNHEHDEQENNSYDASYNI